MDAVLDGRRKPYGDGTNNVECVELQHLDHLDLLALVREIEEFVLQHGGAFVDEALVRQQVRHRVQRRDSAPLQRVVLHIPFGKKVGHLRGSEAGVELVLDELGAMAVNDANGVGIVDAVLVRSEADDFTCCQPMISTSRGD